MKPKLPDQVGYRSVFSCGCVVTLLKHDRSGYQSLKWIGSIASTTRCIVMQKTLRRRKPDSLLPFCCDIISYGDSLTRNNATNWLSGLFRAEIRIFASFAILCGGGVSQVVAE
ncbi:MAG: hypothetical protein HYU39_01560 [Thaumarchaeota archaeon]|nr:hypothetical protein [Nitrososphaerota archaeon]